MLKEGKCDHVKCKFSHDPEDLKRSFASLEVMVKNNERRFGTPPARKPGGQPVGSSE
jgi:hypothetical protein